VNKPRCAQSATSSAPVVCFLHVLTYWVNSVDVVRPLPAHTQQTVNVFKLAVVGSPVQKRRVVAPLQNVRAQSSSVATLNAALTQTLSCPLCTLCMVIGGAGQGPRRRTIQDETHPMSRRATSWSGAGPLPGAYKSAGKVGWTAQRPGGAAPRDACCVGDWLCAPLVLGYA
jgi:hypothetical protein